MGDRFRVIYCRNEINNNFIDRVRDNGFYKDVNNKGGKVFLISILVVLKEESMEIIKIWSFKGVDVKEGRFNFFFGRYFS